MHEWVQNAWRREEKSQVLLLQWQRALQRPEKTSTPNHHYHNHHYDSQTYPSKQCSRIAFFLHGGSDGTDGGSAASLLHGGSDGADGCGSAVSLLHGGSDGADGHGSGGLGAGSLLMILFSSSSSSSSLLSYLSFGIKKMWNVRLHDIWV